MVPIDFSLEIWFEYLLRFSHLVAGIAWIGSSFYFIWLDSSFTPPEIPRKNVEGELFMVHGGFYYSVEKRKIFPGEIPKTLHWFKWEATFTWITGFLLLIALYYLNGATLLIDSSINKISPLTAVTLSLTIVALSWLIYDLIWSPQLFKRQSVSLFLSAVFFTGLVYLNFQVFSGRGAFMQTGVVFGTIMLLNVWIRILPGQAKMLKTAQSGQVPDYSIGQKSKIRSVHNTYFTFPVLFIMLSNHFPAIYNHEHRLWLLVLLAISGALVRHAMVTKNIKERWLALPAAAGFAALVLMTAKSQAITTNTPARGQIEFAQIQAIFVQHCHSCHSQTPTDEIFTIPPKGLVFETEEQIRSAAQSIYQQVVVSKVMPLTNKNSMSDEERAVIAHWITQSE